MLRVALVDDDQFAAFTLKKILEKLGLEVTSFLDPEEALSWINENTDSLDLVVTDLNMPNLPGLELIQELDNRGINLPVLIASGEDLDDEYPIITSKSVFGIISKPVDMEAVEILLENFMQDRKPAK